MIEVSDLPVSPFLSVNKLKAQSIIKSFIWETMNLLRVHIVVEHPTHGGSAPLWNTLLTVDLPHRRTTYPLWT